MPAEEGRFAADSRVFVTAKQGRVGKKGIPSMIDYFAIALTHGLLALACLRLLTRGDLDRDPNSEEEVPPTATTENGTEKKGKWRVRRA